MSPSTNRYVILLADDDAGTRLMVASALEQAGFEVVEAASGEEVMERFSRADPNLVLLDVMMPGIDGFETCERIRARADGEQVPIVMMTGLDDVGSISRAYDAGATDFLTKPINYMLLTQRVRYILRATHMAMDLHESQARLAHAQRLARLASWSWARDATGGKVTQPSWSDELYALLGITRDACAPSLNAFLELVHPEDRERFHDHFSEALAGRPMPPFEHRLNRPDGEERTLSHITEAVRDGHDRPLLILGTVQDVTERRRQEQRIAQLVYFDELTGLPNRSYVAQALARRLEESDQVDSPLALLSIGLDRFKRINNTLGHAAGDGVLVQVAMRLRETLRWSDTLALGARCESGSRAPSGSVDTLARIGADEFLVFLSEVRRPEDAAVVANRILGAFGPQFDIDGVACTITASIGIIVYPDNGRDVQTLLTNVDAAMQHAKDDRRSNFKFYSEEIHQRAAARLSLEGRLRRAVDNGDFELHFQPRVEPGTGWPCSAEALIRWRASDGDLISPGDFIPLAEESGLIVPIGAWALEHACAQLKAWRRDGVDLPKVSVNLSGVQFHGGRLTREIADLITRHEMPTRSLELEVTESILIEDSAASRRLLIELKEMGVELAVDDFGTGYSSMSYLKRFPLNALKIDRCFVSSLEHDAEDKAIVKATVALGHSFGLRVVAEGVETSEQLAIVSELGCDEVQGYFFSRPLPAARLVAWMSGLREAATA